MTLSTHLCYPALDEKGQSLKRPKLKKERGATFEEIVTGGELLAVRKSPNYEDQWFEIYFYENYVWVVVTGTEPDRFITLYKSRKHKKEFGL